MCVVSGVVTRVLCCDLDHLWPCSVRRNVIRLVPVFHAPILQGVFAFLMTKLQKLAILIVLVGRKFLVLNRVCLG